MKKKPGMTMIATLATAVVLVDMCVYAVFAQETRQDVSAAPDETGGMVELRELETEILQVEPTTAPTPEPYELPEGAVEIWCDRKPLMALATKAEAETLLMDYLNGSLISTETEKTLRAAFDCELLIVDATGALPLSEPDQGLKTLLDEPSLVPVLLETERREMQTASAAEVQTHDDPALAKGSRIVSQLGTAARVVTTTMLTYRAGEVVTGSDPVSETQIEARTTIVRRGTYRSEEPAQEPDSAEGEIGRSAEGLDFTAPIKGARIRSYFGTREDRMHWGVDYEARAGTDILAPEEGLVVYCGERGEYGFVIDIDHGGGFVSRLTHCEDVQVELHQRVFRGEKVAALAPLADATAGKPHLHYELLIDGVPHNPVPYL